MITLWTLSPLATDRLRLDVGLLRKLMTEFMRDLVYADRPGLMCQTGLDAADVLKGIRCTLTLDDDRKEFDDLVKELQEHGRLVDKSHMPPRLTCDLGLVDPLSDEKGSYTKSCKIDRPDAARCFVADRGQAISIEPQDIKVEEEVDKLFGSAMSTANRVYVVDRNVCSRPQFMRTLGALAKSLSRRTQGRTDVREMRIVVGENTSELRSALKSAFHAQDVDGIAVRVIVASPRDWMLLHDRFLVVNPARLVFNVGRGFDWGGQRSINISLQRPANNSVLWRLIRSAEISARVSPIVWPEKR